MGAAPNPAVPGWEKSWGIRGAGPLHLQPAPAVSERDPSSHSQHQRLHRPAQHRSGTSATAAVPAKPFGDSPTPSSPSLPGGPARGTSPHPFIPAQEFFFAVSGAGVGQGRRERQHHGGTGARRPSLARRGASAAVPRAASHPASGPGERRRKMSGS